MKKAFFKILAVLAAVAMMLPVCALCGYSASTMAFNIYADPVTSGTSGRYDTFTIDFRSGMTPNYTYWALANFSLYFSPESRSMYPNITGGGAYAGLQNRSPSQGRAGIMSFWEMKYDDQAGDEVIMTATRVFPSGEGTFTGEGNGTNIIARYPWENNKWYRMVLHSWEDAETGTTFVGQWFQDVESGKWTLFSYFDTHLVNSALQGGMGLFQENYVGSTYDQVREFNTKNIYVQDYVDKAWKSLDTVNISYGDGGNPNKAGRHEFGATEEYFWGRSGGIVGDQASYDAASTKSARFTVKQPDKPTFGMPSLTGLEFTADEDGKVTVNWTCSETATPQLSYDLKVFGTDGTVLFQKSETRPHVTSCVLEGLNTDAYKCVLTVTDIFGEQTTLENETEAYTKLVNRADAFDRMDLDRNGKWGIGDVTLLLNVLSGADVSEGVDPDVDYNDVCSISDVSYMLNAFSEGCLHVSQILPAKEATYTEPGLTEGKCCSVCGEVFKAQTEIPIYKHIWGDWKVSKQATTTKEGEMERICTACGQKEIEKFSKAIGLTLSALYGKIENYGTPKKTLFIAGGVDKEIIGKLYSGKYSLKNVVVTDETTGKVYSFPEYFFDAFGSNKGTEADSGNALLRLAFCDYGMVPAVDHAYTVSLDIMEGEFKLYEGRSAVGAFSNSTNGDFCSNGAIVPQIAPHTYAETDESGTHEWKGRLIKPTSCAEEGTMEYTCAHCGKVKTEAIPLIPHKEEYIPAEYPSCTEPGLSEGKKCSVCGKILEEQKEVPAGHHWDVWKVVKQATVAAEGRIERACIICGQIQSQTTAKLPNEGYTFENGVLTVYKDFVCDYNDAASIDGYPWASLRSKITKVVIADGVTGIGHHAFTRCSNLAEVVTGKTCSSIGMDAFSYNAKLKYITFGCPITEFGQGVVYSSTAIQKVTLTNQTLARFKEVSQVNAYNWKEKGGVATGFDKSEFVVVSD